MSNRLAASDSGHLLVVGTGIFITAFIGTVAPDLAGPAAVVILAMVVALVVHLRRSNRPGRPAALSQVLVVGCAAFTALGAALLGSPGALVLVPVYMVAALGLTAKPGRSERMARSCGALLVVLTLGLLVGILALNPSVIDVGVFLRESVDALLRGSNPYTHAYSNIYDAEATQRFYGEGVVKDGKIVYGYPYPPAILLLTVPGYLLGDARVSSVLAVTAAALVLLLRARAVHGRVAAVLLVCAPGLVSITIAGWVEPIIVGLLAAFVVALHARRLVLAAAFLGLLFVSKQYFVVLVPCLWLLRPYYSRPRLAVAVCTALAVNLPFLLWSPSSFWRALVEWQFIQPYRPDSISLTVWSVETFAWPPASIYGPLPLVAGFVTAVVLAMRMRPGPASFSLSLAIALAVTVLLSKQAFLNYYCLVGGAIFIAAWSVAEQAQGPKDAGMPRANGERAAYPDVLVPDASRSRA